MNIKHSSEDPNQELSTSYRSVQELDRDIENSSDDDTTDKREKRNQAFANFQRTRLLVGSKISIDEVIDISEVENEVESALLWMTEKGEQEEDLIAVKEFKRDSPLVANDTSDDLHPLLSLAQGAIEKRLIDKQSIHADSQKNGYEKEAIVQRLRLLIAANVDEIKTALSWMNKHGKKVEDLIAIKNVILDPAFASDEVHELLSLSEDNITNRIISEKGSLNYYQIVVDRVNDYRSRFGYQLYSIEDHGSFSIVIASSEVVERLKEHYPVGKISHAKTIPKNDPDLKPFFDPNLNRERTMEVVQLNVPITNKLRKQIRDTRAEIIAPLGQGEFVLLVPDREVANNIQKIPEVIQLKPYNPNIDKRLEYLDEEDTLPAQIIVNNPLQQKTFEPLTSGDIYFPGMLIITFFREEDRIIAAENFKRENIEIVEEAGDDTLVVDLIHYHENWKKAFKIIKNQPGLRAIEQDSPASLFNNLAVALIAEKVVALQDPIHSNSLNLTGKGETIAIADTGLDTGDPTNIHPDLQGRVQNILPLNISVTKYKNRINQINFSPIGADLYSGHGTHIVGSAIGSGSIYSQDTCQNSISGVASEAQVFFQAIGFKDAVNSAEGLAPPTKLSELFELASKCEDKVQIYAISWGDSDRDNACQYNSKSRDIDKFMWENKDFLVVTAAGNNGIHSDEKTEWVDLSSICPPGTAKNCLTVGASENNRHGQFTTTYGDRNSQRFPYPPLNNNCLVDSINDIAAFSGRGPCEDGRYKPDVIAPGTFILSTRSSLTTEFGSAPYEHDRSRYMYMCGTSMATPLVAGGAALVRQYLKGQNIEHPSAALVKATIIHSAQYIDYQHKHQNSCPWVDNEQGWGRVNLANSLNPEQPTQVIFQDCAEGLVTGEKYEYEIRIEDNRVPIRIILAYTDFPAKQLINNLNLILYSPNNQQYYVGNYFENHTISAKWLDNTNNVEGIVVPLEDVKIGTWRIVVIASTIVEATQEFSLVASGGGLELVTVTPYLKPENR